MSEGYTINNAEQRALIEAIIKEIDELLALRQGFNEAYRDWKEGALERLRQSMGEAFANEVDRKGPRQTPINRQHRVHIYRQRLHAQQRFLQELLEQGTVQSEAN